MEVVRIELSIKIIVVCSYLLQDVNARCILGEHSCPNACRCSQNTVTCKSQKLVDFPDVPATTAILLLDQNQIKRISETDLDGCQHLKELHLTDNFIDMIDNGTFLQTPKLNMLYLNGNKIVYSSLPDGCFSGLGKLTFLNVANNEWNESTGYNGNIFRPLSQVQVLYIDAIPNKPFPQEIQHFRSLKRLYVHGGLTTVANDTFAAFSNSPIFSLVIYSTYLIAIEELSFANFTKLKTLDLSGNIMLVLNNASRAWYGLRFTKINRLVLYNTISYDSEYIEVESGFYRYLEFTKIGTLNLQSNSIKRISSGFSSYLPNLGSLNLAYNHIQNAKELARDLAGLPNLRTLDVSHQIWPSPRERSKEPVQHEWLNAAMISRKSRSPKTTQFASPYSIGDCRIGSYGKCPEKGKQSHTDPVCFALPPKLKKLDMQESFMAVRHALPKLVIENGTNLQEVRLSSNGLRRIEGPVEFVQPVSNLMVDLSDNQITCFAPDLFERSANTGSNITALILSSNQLANQLQRDTAGRTFKHYSHLKILSLSNNGLKTLPRRIFEYVQELHLLNLSQNSLKTIEFDFHSMDQLNKLDISFNLIASLNSSLLQTFTSIFESRESSLTLNLTGNPLQCSCETLEFLRWADAHSKRLAYFDSYFCLYPKEYVNFSRLHDFILVELEYECSKRTAVIAATTVVAIVLILIAISTACYRHRWEIRYQCLKLTHQSERYLKLINETQQYDYDAFVVYDSEDRQWVLDTLLPHLEVPRLPIGSDATDAGRHTQPLRLCVHERDFPPGQEIIGNIWTKMENSRKVVLVISKNFTLSRYCDYEMNLARMHSVEQGRNVIVPILLEQPDVERISASLHWILRKITYLEWPANENERNAFWEQLQDSLTDDL